MSLNQESYKGGFNIFFVFIHPQKRALDRAKKVKKVGVRYYETHNVKNKNKNRKFPTEGQMAKRSKQ